MSGSPSPQRLAVLQSGERQGSGYLLTPRLVLTAAHVATGAGPVRVTAPEPRTRERGPAPDR